MTDKPTAANHAIDPTAGVKASLLSAFRKLLRPLIRILIRHGVSFAEFAEVIKAIYVDSASNDFALPGRKSSGSRVAILTGLTRKEVKRLSSSTAESSKKAGTNLSRAGRVLTGWHNDKDFLVTHYGIPRDITFDDGSGTDFSELVRRYSGDMPARAMLEELKRVGAVEETEDNLIHVISRSYIPSPLNPDSIARIGITLHDLAATLDFNLTPDRKGRGRFERRVYTTEGISKDKVGEFQDLVDKKGQQFLETLDNWLTACEAEYAAEEGEDRAKIGLGLYLFQHDSDD